MILKNFWKSTDLYSYSQVKKMTNSFAEKLGQGGYGSVYKGTLLDGHPVAVKMLNVPKGEGKEFLNEVAAISTTSHVNIVILLGFCSEGHKRALVYEFIPNGSLDKLIFHKTTLILGSENIHRIAIGIPQGLQYLHSLELENEDENISDEDGDIVRKLKLIGLWCIQTNPSERPTMSNVIEMLQGNQTIDIPPKPFLSSSSSQFPLYSSTASSG